MNVGVILLQFTCVHGFYIFDLNEVMGLTPEYAKEKKISVIDGPVTGTTAYAFDRNTEAFYVSSEKSNDFAYITHTVSTSKDLTFATRFMLTKDPLAMKQQYWPIFSLHQSDINSKFFSIGFQFTFEIDQVEDEQIKSDMKPFVYIQQWTQRGVDVQQTAISVDKLLKVNKWQSLMVRIRNGKVVVYVDCNELPEQELQGGLIESYLLKGYITLGESIGQSAFKGIEAKEQFLGALYAPQIYNGEEAYEFFNPCWSDLTPSIVPPEPRPQDYDPYKFQQYIKMTSANIDPVYIYCKEGGKQYVNNEVWRVKCIKKTCGNGKVSEKFVCPVCEQNGVIHKEDDKWEYPKCTQNICYEDGYMESTPMICGALQCNEFGNTTDPNRCCPICYEKSCKADREYYEGCDRKCEDGAEFVCEKKEKGCWCPMGHALDEKNKCVPLQECSCKSGLRSFKSGEVVRRSSCSVCVCASASLLCMTSCNS